MEPTKPTYSLVNKMSGKAEEVLNIIPSDTFITAQTGTIGVRFEKNLDEEGNIVGYENDSFTLVEGEPVDELPAQPAPAEEVVYHEDEIAAEDKVEDVELAPETEAKVEEPAAPAEVAADTSEPTE